MTLPATGPEEATVNRIDTGLPLSPSPLPIPSSPTPVSSASSARLPSFVTTLISRCRRSSQLPLSPSPLPPQPATSSARSSH
ncbi:hypothetical protein BROUX41_001830 [Berkeleyomyces rouxiae]